MGYRIKEIREAKGMTQVELAERAGVTRVTIWRLESGDGLDTTITTLRKIADALGVGVNEIFFTESA